MLADGSVYEAPVYEFPEEFFIHTFSDGSMTAVDASGVPLPIQPEMGHGGPEGMAVSDYAVLPDGTMYIPPPLYPPAGEPPEEWPPPGWGDEDDQEPVTSEVEDEAEDSVEAAVDQGPDVASAEPATPSPDGDGIDDVESAPIGSEMEGDVDTDEVAPPADASRAEEDSPVGDTESLEVAELLTAGLVDAPSEGVVSATPIQLPGDPEPVPVPDGPVPVGGDEVSATPITLPGQEVPVGGDEVSGLPVPIPGGELPTGGEDVSVLPIPVPEPPASGGVDPAPERSVDDEIALDRKGGDAPVGVGVEEVPPTDVELAVEAVEEVHVEEVRFEEVEVDTVESIEPAFEPEISVLDEEGIDDLDA